MKLVYIDKCEISKTFEDDVRSETRSSTLSLLILYQEREVHETVWYDVKMLHFSTFRKRRHYVLVV